MPLCAVQWVGFQAIQDIYYKRNLILFISSIKRGVVLTHFVPDGLRLRGENATYWLTLTDWMTLPDAGSWT